MKSFVVFVQYKKWEEWCLKIDAATKRSVTQKKVSVHVKALVVSIGLCLRCVLSYDTIRYDRRD